MEVVEIITVSTGMSAQRLKGMSWDLGPSYTGYVSDFIPEPLLLQAAAYHCRYCIELHYIAH